jgi:Ca-activated chloride channel family protein
MNTSFPQDMRGASTLVPASPTLPLEGAALRVTAAGGIARVVLEQRFVNRHAEPLTVTYALPLPADAAVSGYSFRIGDRRIAGEIDRRSAARERHADAIARGQTAALLDQERSSLFTQEIGNVPPGARLVSQITLDQKLRWLEEGCWEWRFPLAAAPRYLGQPGRVTDGGALALAVAEQLSPRASLAMAIGDAVAPGRAPGSPSHRLACTPERAGHRVELAGAELDRDVVVHWAVAELAPRVTAWVESTSHGTHALLTIVPPAREAAPAVVPRDLIVLLDTSGSMEGAPLEQAKRVAMALVDGLRDHDTFELIEFSIRTRRFASSLLPATPGNRAAALTWLAALRAAGGTEMRDGILTALHPVRPGGQRQVVVVSDGLIGFEQEIVGTILERLPADARVHMVGVGSSVNRSLTAPAARAGRGAEIVLGLGEDAERAVQRLRARIEAPVIVDVTVSGDAVAEIVPAKIPDLYAGCPVLIGTRIRREGSEIIVRGRSAAGDWEKRLRVAPVDVESSAVRALFGREAVEDCELRLAAGASPDAMDRAIEELGLQYGIATRLTSWIAIDTTPSVDPQAPGRREVIPQALPYGMSVEGLGLREVSTRRRPESMLESGAARMPDAGAPRARFTAASSRARPRPVFLGSFTGASRPLVPAQVVDRRGREIAIEIAVPMELRWDPESFDVLLVHGGELHGRVDLSRTTRAGMLQPGQVARITLVLDRDSGDRILEIVFARQAFVVV